jgi:hypothetical protein
VVRAGGREALSGAGHRLGLPLAPATRLTAGGAQLTARAIPVTDPAEVGEILDKFRARYGARDVAAYYPKQDVALEVPLA